MFLVATALANLRRDRLERVVLGVEGVDLLEREAPAPLQLQRVGDLAALDQLGEDAVRRRPGSDRNRGARFGERFANGKAEAAVVRDAPDERSLTGEIDSQHARHTSRHPGRLLTRLPGGPAPVDPNDRAG